MDAGVQADSEVFRLNYYFFLIPCHLNARSQTHVPAVAEMLNVRLILKHVYGHAADQSQIIWN